MYVCMKGEKALVICVFEEEEEKLTASPPASPPALLLDLPFVSAFLLLFMALTCMQSNAKTFYILQIELK